jgi:ClpP class serine protease
LDFIGVKYELQGTNSKENIIWNQFLEISEKEKVFTQKWLDTVEANMLDIVSKRRSIPKSDLELIKNKLFSPKEALKHKLID